jgi:hypothetical protein
MLVGMRTLPGIVALFLMVSPEMAIGQQKSMAFAHPIGVERSRSDAGFIGRRSAFDDDGGAGVGQYVAVGALVGGLLAGGWAAYETYRQSSNGGEMMISPLIPIGIVAAGGVLVGGIIGLSIYFGAHPK